MSNFEFDNPRPFKFWCHKVLPLVYDDSLSYYELLCKVIDSLNKTIGNVEILENGFIELKNYVDHYFDNLDVTEEINNKLDEMAENGTLETLVARILLARKVLFVGDSFATQSYSWIDYVKTALGLTSETGISVAVTGTSFHDGTFLDEIENWNGDKLSITDIVVGGGLNDSTFNSTGEDATALSTAIIAFANYAKTNYPNAKVWIAFMGNALDNSSVIHDRTIDKRLWAKFIYKISTIQNGMIFIEDVEKSLCTSDLHFADDRLHPSTSGARQLGMVIANAMRGCNNKPYYPPYIIRATPIEDTTFVDDIAGTYSVDGDNITVNLPTIIQRIGEKYSSFNHGVSHDLFTINGLYFNEKHTIFVPLRLDGYGEKSYQEFVGELTFDGYTVSLFTGAIADDNTGFLVDTADANNSSVSFPNGITFTFPTFKVN